MADGDNVVQLHPDQSWTREMVLASLKGCAARLVRLVEMNAPDVIVIAEAGLVAKRAELLKSMGEADGAETDG